VPAADHILGHHEGKLREPRAARKPGQGRLMGVRREVHDGASPSPADFARGLDAVGFSSKLDVHQHQIRLRGLDLSQGEGRPVRRAHDFVSQTPEYARNMARDERLILDDQDLGLSLDGHPDSAGMVPTRAPRNCPDRSLITIPAPETRESGPLLHWSRRPPRRRGRRPLGQRGAA